MEYLRVEVRKIQDGELPPVILPRVGGHRRVYTQQHEGQWYMLNVMCIGASANGITFGEVDEQIMIQCPETYFRELTSFFMNTALGLGVCDHRVAFILWIDENHPEMLPGQQNVGVVT